MLPRRLLAPTLLTVACLACPSVASAQSGRVNGIVRGEGGDPVKGATITAEMPNTGMSLTATTDDKGRFIMIGLRGGEWRFIAQAVGYSPEGGAMLVRTGSPNPPLTFQLERSGVAYFGALAGIMAKDLQRYFTEADRLYADQRWDESIVAYRGILERAPVLTNIHLQIAAAYRNKKEYDAALAEYGKLLEAEPGNSRAPLEIGLTWLERGDSRAAEDTLVKASQQQSATRDVFYTLGEIRLSANDHAGAATWFEKASAADPNWAKPLLKLGEVALALGENEAAARHLARAAEVDPTAPEAAAAKSTLETLKK